MNNPANDQLNENNDHEVDLLEIFKSLNQGKWIIVSMTAFFFNYWSYL